MDRFFKLSNLANIIQYIGSDKPQTYLLFAQINRTSRETIIHFQENILKDKPKRIYPISRVLDLRHHRVLSHKLFASLFNLEFIEGWIQAPLKIQKFLDRSGEYLRKIERI